MRLRSAPEPVTGSWLDLVLLAEPSPTLTPPMTRPPRSGFAGLALIGVGVLFATRDRFESTGGPA